MYNSEGKPYDQVKLGFPLSIRKCLDRYNY